MQYDRNDEIIYDEGFTSSAEREYYTEYSEDNDDYDRGNFSSVRKEKRKTFPLVLCVQITLCILCGLFLYLSKMYAPDFYSNLMDNINELINDSLVVDGNNINDYFK